MPRLPAGVIPPGSRGRTLAAALLLLVLGALPAPGARALAWDGDGPALPKDGEADAEAVKGMDAKEKARRLRLAMDHVARDFAALKTLRAKFEQKKKLDVLEEEAVSRGSLAVAMPSKLRWEYAEPIKTLLVVNGDRARRERTSRKGEVTSTTFALKEDPVAAATTEQVFLWVGGRTAEAAKSHDIGLESEKPLRVRATPKDERVAKVIVDVDLEFSGDPVVLSRIVLNETSKTRTEISFSSVERNPDLAADLFDVGEERGR